MTVTEDPAAAALNAATMAAGVLDEVHRVMIDVIVAGEIEDRDAYLTAANNVLAVRALLRGEPPPRHIAVDPALTHLQQQVVDALERLLAVTAWDDVTVDDLVRAARCSRDEFDAEFADKREAFSLLYQVASRRGDRMDPHLRAIGQLLRFEKKEGLSVR